VSVERFLKMRAISYELYRRAAEECESTAHDRSSVIEAARQWQDARRKEGRLITDCLFSDGTIHVDMCKLYQVGGPRDRRDYHENLKVRRERCRLCRHYSEKTIIYHTNRKTKIKVTEERYEACLNPISRK
jgi:hypothetical protein